MSEQRFDCETYCEHGGVCVLNKGHEGLHDSGYCRWSDEQSLSKEAADALLSAKIADVFSAFDYEDYEGADGDE